MKIKGRGCVNVACVMNYMIEMVIIYYLFEHNVFLFLLLGMDSSIPGDTSFTNLLEDSFNEYMSGSSHISGEDSDHKLKHLVKCLHPKLNPQLRNYNVAVTSPYKKTCFLCLHFSMSIKM